jgi:uncharacterized protein YjbI with pentapeptide repeats
MDAEQLEEILQQHSLWLKDPKKGKRADLSGADLRGAYLRGAYLRGAYLRGADLIGADLSEADLREANFTVELKDTVNLHTTFYNQQQFPFLALNLSFLESV